MTTAAVDGGDPGSMRPDDDTTSSLGGRLWTVALQPERYDSPIWEHWRWTPDEGDELARIAGLHELVADALALPAARPRVARIVPGGLLVVLRGVNLNAGADPDDMVSLRVWLEPTRIISVELRTVRSVREVHAVLTAPEDEDEPRTERPRNGAHLVVDLATTLLENMRPVVDDVEERVSEIEEAMVDEDARTQPGLPREIATLRKTAVVLRRHLGPQRDALARLPQELGELRPTQAAELRESIDRAQRYLEDIDSLVERAAVLREEFDHRLGLRMDRLTYMFSVVAVVFLPLGFLTGLLGINVGGIPLAEHAGGFAIICIALVVLVVAEVAVLRWLRVL